MTTFRAARVSDEEITAARDRKTLTPERVDRLNEWLRARAIEDGMAPSIAAGLRVAYDRDPHAVRRLGKDWNACPYASHSDDCNCGGAGGDR